MRTRGIGVLTVITRDAHPDAEIDEYGAGDLPRTRTSPSCSRSWSKSVKSVIAVEGLVGERTGRPLRTRRALLPAQTPLTPLAGLIRSPYTFARHGGPDPATLAGTALAVTPPRACVAAGSDNHSRCDGRGIHRLAARASPGQPKPMRECESAASFLSPVPLSATHALGSPPWYSRAASTSAFKGDAFRRRDLGVLAWTACLPYPRTAPCRSTRRSPTHQACFHFSRNSRTSGAIRSVRRACYRFVPA